MRETPPMRERMTLLVQQTQTSICKAIEQLDGGRFREDSWERPGGGGGLTRVLQDGQIFEKAGVNHSIVAGTLTQDAVRAMGGGKHLKEGEALQFFAAGISLVLHPHNPMAPTVHANYRYFERSEPGATSPSAWWFGGGSDLTPSYLFEEDAAHFHKVHKEACDRHDPNFYQRFKAWADDYFLIKHRGERRGVGGIFFDDLCDREADALFNFVEACANAFLPAYMPLIERRYQSPFASHHKEWQQLRRGRYVEFNLVYDRGTLFGLNTGGRIESILMSLPLTARWQYDHTPAPDSEEGQMLSVLRNPRGWL